MVASFAEYLAGQSEMLRLNLESMQLLPIEETKQAAVAATDMEGAHKKVDRNCEKINHALISCSWI